MTGRRLFGIAVIFTLATFAWLALGSSVQIRTGDKGARLADEVSGLWGSPQDQQVPQFTGATGAAAPELIGSDVVTDFRLDQRRKGLLWYATYVVDFSAVYRVSNPSTSAVDAQMLVTFPDANGLYDGFAVVVDGKEVPVKYASGQAQARFRIPANGTASVSTGYTTNGMDRWSYSPSPGGAGIIKDFSLTANTDFVDVDFPSNGVSPTSSVRSGEGWKLRWAYDSVVSGQPVGVVMPVPLNPGPIVSRITFFAPVSLIFFFAALVLLTTTSRLRIHPVHYGFLAAAFFAFHLLLAYLADQVDLNAAFFIAAVTSVVLVLAYLRTVVGANRALLEIAVSQFVFLVLFSYSFFFEGFTGLAVTIGSVVTLAFFMWKTARVDWDTVFVPRPRAGHPPEVTSPAVTESGAGL